MDESDPPPPILPKTKQKNPEFSYHIQSAHEQCIDFYVASARFRLIEGQKRGIWDTSHQQNAWRDGIEQTNQTWVHYSASAFHARVRRTPKDSHALAQSEQAPTSAPITCPRRPSPLLKRRGEHSLPAERRPHLRPRHPHP